jgi:hypothetical protein
VADVDVRDGRNTLILAVATWRHAGGWRLSSMTELQHAVADIRTEQPWVAGERMRRRVLLPDTSKPKMLSGSYRYDAV